MDISLSDLKNPQTIASTTAIAISLTSIIYFQQKLNQIIHDQEELKLHLSALISSVDPSTKNQIEQLKIAVHELDSKILSHDEKIREISSRSGEQGSQSPDKEERTEKRKRYVRYTTKSSASSKPFTGIRLKENETRETDHDLDAETLAMQD